LKALRAVGSAFLFTLSACGGGHSGSSSPMPDPNQTSFRFQGASTTVVYPVDSAAMGFSTVGGVSASGIDPAGAGSTLTVTTDAEGRISSLTITVTTAGVNFSHTYDGSTLHPLSTPLTLASLANLVQRVGNAAPGATGFVFQAPGLSFSTFGTWLSNDGGSNFREGVLAGGTQTASMPTLGTATYNGSTTGFGANGAASFVLMGNAQILANFGNGSVTTTFSNLTTQDVNTNAVGALPNQTGSGIISGNRYSTAISGGSMSGGANGTFYGSTAQETAGVWKSSGGGITAMGSFGAHQ
jgi:transferrin binding protein